MIGSSYDDTYRGPFLPAIRKVSEVLPAVADGRSFNRDHIAPADRLQALTHSEGVHGGPAYYGRTSAVSAGSQSVGPRVYTAKGTYIDTWA
jgi:hypothetical protein